MVAHRLIGLTGTNGAGKSEVAAILRERGYAYVSLSDELRVELKKKGVEPTRDNLIAAGNALRRRFGPDILARRVMKKIAGPTVIDSIRTAREVAFFRRQKGFVLVAVDAPVRLRFLRVHRRGRPESAATLAEFIAKESEEMSGGRTGQQLRRTMAMADVTIWNDGSRAALRRKVTQCLL